MPKPFHNPERRGTHLGDVAEAIPDGVYRFGATYQQQVATLRAMVRGVPCGRCGGRLVVESALDSPNIACVNCGGRSYPDIGPPPSSRHPTRSPRFRFNQGSGPGPDRGGSQ